MSKFEKRKVMPRYVVIAVVLTLMGIAVVGRAGYIMTAKKDYWEKVAARQKQQDDIVEPTRGNIFSCDGQLMASTLPEYKIFLDFQPGKRKNEEMDTAVMRKLDTLWMENMDTLCAALHQLFPAKTAQEFKEHILKGRSKVNSDGSVGARHWPIWSRRIDYNKFVECRKLPIFELSAGKGGFHWETYNTRKLPFGSLASRTLGGLKKASDSAYFGLELAYDSVLRGTNGIVRRQKVRNQFTSITVTPPVDGCDIVTTIDVGMQDLVERSLIAELKKPEVHGDMGVAILMEVETGDVKAVANLTRGADGEYYEMQNHALNYRCEPGSVFKVASMLVALDDGVVDTSFVIHTGNGIMKMHGRDMKDHNWRRGGYGDINVARTLEVSSNVGVSYVIDRFYGEKPEKYVEGLYRIGIHDDLGLNIPGYESPIIDMPQKNAKGKYVNWYKTKLPWMSIGYETQIAPINTVTFYNAIANDGKMMRPRFVKRIVKDGVTVREVQPEVIRERIAKPQTIKTMQTVLTHVVSQGLGRKAGSRSFAVAGKTGTAQVSKGKGGYKVGIVDYWLSFCGFFPADNPKYTCIVCIRKSGLPASGGGMSGVVFHHIAEGVMAHSLKLPVESARDTSTLLIPDVKAGNIQAAEYVLRQLGIRTTGNWADNAAVTQPVWGKATRQPSDVSLAVSKMADDVMPDVLGMGASDALYLLEDMGVGVKLHGRGRVSRQSIAAGTALKRGMICELNLE